MIGTTASRLTDNSVAAALVDRSVTRCARTQLKLHLEAKLKMVVHPRTPR